MVAGLETLAAASGAWKEACACERSLPRKSQGLAPLVSRQDRGSGGKRVSGQRLPTLGIEPRSLRPQRRVLTIILRRLLLMPTLCFSLLNLLSAPTDSQSADRPVLSTESGVERREWKGEGSERRGKTIEASERERKNEVEQSKREAADERQTMETGLLSCLLVFLSHRNSERKRGKESQGTFSTNDYCTVAGT